MFFISKDITNTEQNTIGNNHNHNVITEEIKFQYTFYLVVFFTTYLASLMIPAFLFLLYIYLYFIPNFLDVANFFSIFTEIKSLLALIFMPIIVITCYLIRLFLIALITRGFWGMTEKRSPTKDGVIPRNIRSDTLNYYHLRSFLIKYGKNTFMKGIFPFFSKWFYNFVGSSKIGKGTVIEESVCNDKHINLGKNVYIGVNSAVTSHLVDGIFGNINYFEVKLGDNVTTSCANPISPGTEIQDNSYLLPLAALPKHSVLKGKNYYWGIPARRIFKKKTMQFLDLNKNEMVINEDLIDENQAFEPLRIIDSKKDITKISELEDEEDETIPEEQKYALDFTTSSAISRINIKFLAVYIPIFWLAGMLITIIFYTYEHFISNWFLMVFFLPSMIIFMWFIFIVACFFFCKLFLILINLIHKPREGIFKAEIGDPDFEFWCLRTELKKIVLWLMRNWPIPWMDILAFKWFGIKLSFSVSLFDAWCDGEFIDFGHKTLIGQGANIMSSMVIGKYLIIKKVIFGDYSLVGGQTTIAPATILGEDTFIGAISNTVCNQILEPGYVYIGIPARKLKPNKYAEERRNVILKKDIAGEKRFEVEHEVNIDEDKKDLV